MRSQARLLAVSFFALSLSCSLLTDVDTRFLNFTEPEGDGSIPECDRTGTIELPEECHDGCDNDNDNAIDCVDEDCANYCCASPDEFLACDDQCDNDQDALIDCDDPDCAGTVVCRPPPPREGVCRGTEEDPECCNSGADGDGDGDGDDSENNCCSNGIDDDGDGDFDCEDDDCTPSGFCCGMTTPHVDEPNGEFDHRYWRTFGGRPDDPKWESKRVVDWRDGNLLGGAATIEPINLDFGLTVTFMALITTGSESCYLDSCPGLAGIALSSASAPQSNVTPMRNLEVLVTSAYQVVVRRAQRILHAIGLDPPVPGNEPFRAALITMNLIPATNEFGENGFRMELRVPAGREVCHDDGSIVGCPAEPEWVSDELVLFAEDNVLFENERGSYLMIIGHGTGVEFSDADGQTIEVGLRSCANPNAWRPSGADDRLDDSFVCWALGAVGSPSIAHVSGSYHVMAVEGTTRNVSVAGYGINNYSLGWLEISGDPDFYFWDQHPDHMPRDSLVFRPIDTEYDHNCMNFGNDDWPEECRGYEEFPLGVLGGCEGVRSHRSPHIIPQTSEHLILFSSAIQSGLPYSQISVATFNPSASIPEWAEKPDTGDEKHTLTLEMVNTHTDGEYRSLRDPVAICHPDSIREDSCGDRYMVYVVGEPDLSSPEEEGWTGDDIIYVEYSISRGFDQTFMAVALDGEETLNNPIHGRNLAEPWILYDEDTEQYFLWITTSLPGQATQVDLLLTTGVGGDHPLAETPWALYPGSPVLTPRDIELLWPIGDSHAADCSGSCVIGGVTGLVVHDDDVEQDILHMWVGIAEMPATDTPPTYHIRHLEQIFGLP